MSDKSKQLFIPKTVKVGFQSREGTYTGKLAYVIYYDLKGVLRKERSWQAWRDHKIDSVEYTNEPTEGFVLNKGVGGVRASYGWNARNEYIRVYDPRDFEFEISVANLLFILREGDCSRGKGLEGKFVYAWDGTELVLLPVSSLDYQNSVGFTSLQDKGVKAKELILGASYTTRKQQILTYLGKFDLFSIVDNKGYGKPAPAVAKRFIFWDGEQFVFMKDLKQVAVLHSDTPVPNYAELVDKYYKSAVGSKPVSLFLRDAPKVEVETLGWRESWVYEESPGVYVECVSYSYNTPKAISYVRKQSRVCFRNGALFSESLHEDVYPSQRSTDSHWGSWGSKIGINHRWVEPTGKHLWVKLESGSEFRYVHHGLVQETCNGESAND